jgi:hypothetical protein
MTPLGRSVAVVATCCAIYLQNRRSSFRYHGDFIASRMATQAANCGERDLPCNVAAKQWNVFEAERLEKRASRKRNVEKKEWRNADL